MDASRQVADIEYRPQKYNLISHRYLARRKILRHGALSDSVHERQQVRDDDQYASGAGEPAIVSILDILSVMFSLNL